jgi:hypothetical protein
MIRPRIRIPRIPRVGFVQQPAKRLIHYIPNLPRFKAEEGVPGFLSPHAFDISWTQYMNMLFTRINTMTARTLKYESVFLSFVLGGRGCFFFFSCCFVSRA